MAEVVKLHGKLGKQDRKAKKHRKNLLFRSRLIGELDSNADLPLVLIHAPAGYGKTVLLKQCQSHLEQGGASTAWLTLNTDDRDYEQLLQRIAAALPDLHIDEVRSGDFGSGENEYVLFLDNVERIVGSEGEKMLLRLQEKHLENLRIYMASRVLPQFGVTRLQISGELYVIDSTRLGFSRDEVLALLELENLNVSQKTAEELYRITEGWPVAVQLACNAIKQDKQEPEDLISSDTFAWRQFHKYVQDEVLKKLSPETRRFLLEIATQGRITPEFAEELTGMEDAASHLAFLEEKGLLVVEDSSVLVHWYRIHSLLSDFLEKVLKKEDPSRLREVHRHAIDWNKKEGRLSDAVKHAFAAGDTLVAAELLERASWERRRHGRPTPVADWSDKLSDEAYDKHPLLRTEAACSFATSFAVEAARVHANTARKNFSDLEPLVRDDLFAVDTLIKIYSDQPEDLLEVSERGLRDCVVRDPYTLGSLHLASSIGHIVRSKLERAKRSVIEARIENDRADNVFGVAVSQMLSGLISAVEGNLTGAADAWVQADETIQPATKLGMVDKIAIGYLPEVLYEWNRLEEAQSYLDRCLDGPIEIMLPDMVASVYLSAARITFREQGIEAASAVLGKAEEIAAEKKWPRLSHAFAWERVRFYLQVKDYEAAKNCRNEIAENSDFIESPGILTHALELEADQIGEFRFEVLTSPNPAIISRLRAAISTALSAGRKWRAVKLLVIEALCRKALADGNAALRTLRTALKYGASSRMIRTFIDEGPVIIGLIRQVRNDDVASSVDIPQDYLDELLEAAGEILPDLEEEPVMLEALSERELEVLKMVFDGCSNAEAARRLFVSENTIKWHLQHIYSKLGVKNRTAAVAAARVLGLVGQ